VCGLLSVGAVSVPSHHDWNLFFLNNTYPSAPFVLSQYDGSSVVVSSGTYLQKWQWRDAVNVGYQYNTGRAAVYGGRVWTMAESSAEQYVFNVLDDKLATANYVLVNTTETWMTAPYWQVAVDEDAQLLYSAAMIDNSMQLHCWQFDVDDNSSSLLFVVALPSPYLPATIYPAAKHTLLLTYEDSTRIHRLDGYTGRVVASFHAPSDTVPTALVESADGSVLYVSAEWPNVAAYSTATHEVSAYYYYSGPWDANAPSNKFTSLVLSGDGEWLFGIAAVDNIPIMRWRVGSSHHIYAPHSPHFTTLGLNWTSTDGISIAAQYSGATIVLQRMYSSSMQRWQLNNSIYLSGNTFQDSLATSYRGRVWVASTYTSTSEPALTFSVLDDQLAAVNSWDVNCSAFTTSAAQWQVAVDEEAELLYSAALIDQTMQLYAWQIGPLGNTTSLVFVSKLPTPYLPAKVYPGAHHTLLVTYQDDTHIYRICGWTGVLLSVFNASNTVPTAVVESHDGRVLYVSNDWPSMAAYDSMTGELMMYYDYADGWGKQPRDTFISASISGDGQWLFAYAQTQTLVVQWRINGSHSDSGKGGVQVAEKPARAASTMKVASE